MNSLKIFTICPADHLKAGKIGVTKAVSSLYAILCFLKFGLMKFILSSGIGRAQICLTVHQIIGNSTERIAINLARKILILSHKYCIELNFFKTPFQITIVRSYRAAMFVLHVDSLKASALFGPKSRAI